MKKLLTKITLKLLWRKFRHQIAVASLILLLIGSLCLAWSHRMR